METNNKEILDDETIINKYLDNELTEDEFSELERRVETDSDFVEKLRSYQETDNFFSSIIFAVKEKERNILIAKHEKSLEGQVELAEQNLRESRNERRKRIISRVAIAVLLVFSGCAVYSMVSMINNNIVIIFNLNSIHVFFISAAMMMLCYGTAAWASGTFSSKK